MSKFSYFAGTKPLPCDTKWSLWAKIVIRLCNLTSTPSMLPSVNDSRRELMVKALKLMVKL